MGLEYNKRLKEQYGKVAVVGYDVFAVGSGLGLGTVTNAVLPDANGIPVYKLSRPAKLDGVTISLATALAAGSGALSVRALVDGTVVGSGVVAAGADYSDVMFETKSLANVNMAADSVLTLDVSKTTGDRVTVSARALIRLLEG